MIKILFVCHGNICRSPMAEFIMKDLVSKAGLDDKFYIESAATSDEELGNPVYPPAKRKLNEHGISCDGKKARQITAADYDCYDHIVIMDRENLSMLRNIIPSDSSHKVSMLLDYTALKREVADPWYTGDFDATWSDIFVGCTGLLATICRERNF